MRIARLLRKVDGAYEVVAYAPPMRHLIAIVGVSLAVLGCAPAKKPAAPAARVRAADVESWAGVPVIELETHAVFSTLPRETRPLSDGSEMWVFKACRSAKTDVRCRSAGTAFGNSAVGAANCSGGDTVENCCHNQFIVKDGAVASYRPTGTCWTDCRARPSSRPCP
jgi:hypothetical protein